MSRLLLEALDLARFFPIVVGPESTGWPKPHPEPLRHAAWESNVPRSRTALIGDSTVDLQCANAAGMDCWIYRGGYDPPAAARATLKFDRFEELCQPNYWPAINTRHQRINAATQQRSMTSRATINSPAPMTSRASMASQASITSPSRSWTSQAHHCRLLLTSLLLLCTTPLHAQTTPDGTADHPLRVMLIPADGGTESGTKADYQPIFNAISRMTGQHFTLTVGQSYGAVVEAMCNHLVEIAFFGPVAYVQAHDRGCAQLLAVAVEKGESVYYAGMFAAKSSPIRTLQDLKGKRVAFGDINSASSFTFQMAMLLEAGLDPMKDLGQIRMTGSHANSIAALAQGQVDVACLSFDSYEKAVREGAIDPTQFKVIAKSAPIPYPPLALDTRLPEPLKHRLKEAFNHVHTAPGITPEMIRGYGGKQVDRYNADFPEKEFALAAAKLALVTDEMKAEIIRRSAQR